VLSEAELETARSVTPSATPGLRGLAILLVLAVVVCYAAVIAELIHQWRISDTYSYGVLVPIISAYLIYVRRSKLRGLQVSPRVVAGGALVAVALALLLLGRSAAIVDLQEISLVLLIPGLVLLTLGWPYLHALWFPLAYLLLMLPVWNVITDRMHYPFQLVSARIGLEMLRTIGIPANLDTIYLTLPNITLEVAEACSGINYLISVVAVGIPLAYLSLGTWSARLGLIVTAIVVAFLSNGLRVALVGSFSYYQIADNLHGPGHVLTGLFVSLVGFAALIGGVAVLARRYPRGDDRPANTESTQPAPSREALRRARVAALAAACALCAAALIRPEFTAAASVNTVLPAALGVWEPLNERPSARFVAGAGDTLYSQVYQAPSGERIEVLVTGFAFNDAVGRLSYRAVRLPTEPRTLDLDLPEGRWRVNHLTIRGSARSTHVVFWYEVAGHVTASHVVAKAYTALQRLGAPWPPARLVMLTTDMPWNPDGDPFDGFLGHLLSATTS
jgi:exosortase